jgi:GrpB-like predicted nucleotidyltransferase (UPF0157 family)
MPNPASDPTHPSGAPHPGRDPSRPSRGSVQPESPMILGLGRGEVRLAGHRAAWQDIFAREKALLASRLGGGSVAIEHVGSTAVPDLLAKPIVDIAVGVASLDDSVSWPEILGLEGYASFGDREGRGEHFYAKGPERERTIYLHVVPVRSRRWDDYLKFRDALRSEASIRREYEKLKSGLAAANPQDRFAYTEAKAAFIHRILMHPPSSDPKLSRSSAAGQELNLR